MGTLFQELKRRNVYRVATGYAITSWLLIQVADTLFPIFDIPTTSIRLLAITLVVGFFVALVLAWIFELTTAGIKKTATASAGERSSTGPTDYLLGGMALFLVGFIVVQQLLPVPLEDDALAEIDAPEGMASELVETAAQEGMVPHEFSIAVLPLANLSPDPENAYFAAGIHEEILNQLVKAKQLQVTSRTTVQRFEDSELSIREIARELNVATIMDGSVRFAGNQVRITTQLIRARDDVHLWSETYQSEYEDIFAIQSDVAIQVASALNATLTSSELAIIERPPTSSTEAYSLFLQAIAGFDSLEAATEFSTARANAISLLERAITIDPMFAQAYAVLAFQKYYVGMLHLEQQSARYEEARYNANKAIEIDPNLALAYVVLQRIYFSEKQWDQWLFNARKSVEIPSLNGSAAFHLAFTLSNLGKHEAAYHWNNIAISKDRESEEHLLEGAILKLNGGDYESSLAFSGQYLDQGGLADEYHTIRALAYHFLERDADSLIELNQIQKTPISIELWGVPEYLHCQTAAREQVPQGIGYPTDALSYMRVLYCALGASDLDTVFDMLDFVIQRNVDLAAIAISPVFDEAKQDPRWQSMEEYMDLPVLTDIQIPY